MDNIKDLEKRIENIENRNKRVEGDKAWETSSLRKALIIILTYIFAVLYLKLVLLFDYSKSFVFLNIMVCFLHFIFCMLRL